MTGQEIFAALSFVDERYIQEAETARLGRNVPWMKVLSVAACICILITGVYAAKLFQPKGATESMVEEAAAPAETMAQQEVDGCPTEAAQETWAETEAGETAAGELHDIPYALLRIIRVEDDRWVAVVEELSDEPTALAVGDQVTVIIEADEVPVTDEEDEIRYGCLLPEEGMLATIEDGAYDAGANILYITGAELEEPAEEG